MKPNKDNQKKPTQSSKNVQDPGKKTTTKPTGKKTESGKSLTESKSKVSTTSTRPQTGKTVETKPAGKGPTKTETKKTQPQQTQKLVVDPYKKFPKFMKLLEKKKDFSGMRTIIQKRFNHWKTITLMQKQQITEKTQKTVVTKKRLKNICLIINLSIYILQKDLFSLSTNSS